MKLSFLLHLAVLLGTTGGNYDYTRNYNGCGSSRGCLFVPPGCQNSTAYNCTGSVWWERVASSGVRFEFTAEIGQLRKIYGDAWFWTAVGISLDTRMNQDTVLECTRMTNGTGIFRVSFNDRTKSEVLYAVSTNLMTDTQVNMQENSLVCRGTWNHAARTETDNLTLSKLFDLSINTTYNILLAKGTANPYTSLKNAHAITDGDFFPWVSEMKCGFCPNCGYCNLGYMPAHQGAANATVAGVRQSSPPRRLKHIFGISHGVLMMSGWWIFASTAILSARYLKGHSAKCAGAPVWWALHRPLNLLAFVCTTVGFFFVYYIGDWTTRTCSVLCATDEFHAQVHAVLGTFTYALTCFQILMGIVRPSKDSPNRHIFAWAHWLCGWMLFVCASTCIVLSPAFGKVGLTTFFAQWPKHVYTIYLCVFILVLGGCEFITRSRRAEKNGSSSPSPMVPLLMLINVAVAIAATAVITWMMLVAFQGYGFTL